MNAAEAFGKGLKKNGITSMVDWAGVIRDSAK